MAKSPHLDLSRRERQIMYIIYERGRATAQEVMDHLPDAPSYSAVRTMLRLLEEKGHLSHYQQGPRYVYEPTKPRDQVRRSAMRHLLQTFFDGSASQAVAALLDVSSSDLSDAELDRLNTLIDQARNEGR